MLLTRREVTVMVAGGIAGSLVPGLLSRLAAAPSLPRNGTFDVMRGKSRIGQHVTTFKPEGNGFRASTELELTVKMAFITLFGMRHTSQELWQGGRLVELKSHTKDGGDVFEVSGEATPKGFRLRNPAGSIVAPAGLHTTNGFWDANALNSKVVIGAQNGGVVGVVVERRGQDNVDVRRAAAERYRMVTPNIAGDLWYAEAEMVKGRLEARGETLDYIRVT
jgi:Family of unknown function (DUF6134)